MTDTAISVDIEDPGFLPGETSRIVERHRESNWSSLDPLKRSFAIEYVKNNCHVIAARSIGRAGQGLQFLRDPLVTALISDLQREYHQNNIVTEEFIRQKLLEILPKVMGEEEVPCVSDKGDVFEAKKFNATAAKAILDSLGGSLKRENGIDVNVNGNITHTSQSSGIREVTELINAIAANPECVNTTYTREDGPVLPATVSTEQERRSQPMVIDAVPGNSGES